MGEADFFERFWKGLFQTQAHEQTEGSLDLYIS